MKRTLKDRLFDWMGAISYTEANKKANRLLDAQRKDHVRVLDEERSKAKELRTRVDELDQAVAECVAGLRQIRVSQPDQSAFNLAAYRREVANETLARLQIPFNDLPTKAYPKKDQIEGTE